MKIKKQILIAMCMITSVVSSGQNKVDNPFGLVYRDAITQNTKGKVTK